MSFWADLEDMQKEIENLDSGTNTRSQDGSALLQSNVKSGVHTERINELQSRAKQISVMIDSSKNNLRSPRNQTLQKSVDMCVKDATKSHDANVHLMQHLSVLEGEISKLTEKEDVWHDTAKLIQTEVESLRNQIGGLKSTRNNTRRNYNYNAQRSERMDRSERMEREDRMERSARLEKVEMAARAERAERAERSGRQLGYGVNDRGVGPRSNLRRSNGNRYNDNPQPLLRSPRSRRNRGDNRVGDGDDYYNNNDNGDDNDVNNNWPDNGNNRSNNHRNERGNYPSPNNRGRNRHGYSDSKPDDAYDQSPDARENYNKRHRSNPDAGYSNNGPNRPRDKRNHGGYDDRNGGARNPDNNARNNGNTGYNDPDNNSPHNRGNQGAYNNDGNNGYGNNAGGRNPANDGRNKDGNANNRAENAGRRYPNGYNDDYNQYGNNGGLNSPNNRNPNAVYRNDGNDGNNVGGGLNRRGNNGNNRGNNGAGGDNRMPNDGNNDGTVNARNHNGYNPVNNGRNAVGNNPSKSAGNQLQNGYPNNGVNNLEANAAPDSYKAGNNNAYPNQDGMNPAYNDNRNKNNVNNANGGGGFGNRPYNGANGPNYVNGNSSNPRDNNNAYGNNQKSPYGNNQIPYAAAHQNQNNPNNNNAAATGAIGNVVPNPNNNNDNIIAATGMPGNQATANPNTYQMQRLQRENGQLLKDVQSLQTDLTSVRTKNSKEKESMQLSLNDAENQLQRMRMQIDNQDNSLQDSQSKIDDLQAQTVVLQSAVEDYDRLKEANAKLQLEYQRSLQDVLSARKEKSMVSQQLSGAQNHISELEIKCRRLSHEKMGIQSELRAQKQSFAQEKVNIEERYTRTIQKLEAELSYVKKMYQEVKGKYRALQNKFETEQPQYQKLKELLDECRDKFTVTLNDVVVHHVSTLESISKQSEKAADMTKYVETIDDDRKNNNNNAKGGIWEPM